MIRREPHGPLGEFGIALPLTLIALLMLSALTIALAMLAQSEPVIAANQQRGAVARALAESAVERALWGLSVGATVSGGIDPPGNGAVAGSPYDGRTYVPLGGGGFTLKLTGVSTTEVAVEAVGWTPDDTSAGNAHRKIAATLMRFPNFGRAAPCALCINGDLEVMESARIDARGDTSCGPKYGAYTSGATSIVDTASVWGAVDGNDANNETTDAVAHASSASFDPITLTPQHLAVLKRMAKTSGTYIGPGSPPAISASWTGTVTFDGSNQIARDGVVFVDTISGSPPSAGNPTDYANVDLHGSPFAGGDFRGWLIVMGNVVASGVSGTIRGLLYAVNDVASSGGATVDGLVVAQNLNNTNGSQIGALNAGAAAVAFNCANANGGGMLPAGWFLTTGSYREVSGR